MNGTAHDEAGPDRSPAPYHDAGEHLFEHLVLLRLYLQRHLVLFTDRYLDSKGRETDAFASRREVEAFLGMEPPGPDAAAQVASVDDAIRAFRANMAARLEASAEAGLRFPVEDLRAAFNLDDTAVDCLVALAAPDLDHGFARAYSHAMCDFTRRHVDVAFLTDLLAGGEPDRGRVWSCFAPSAPLVRCGLVEMGWLADQGPVTRFTERPLKAADRVVAWMRGVRDIDETVLGRAAIVPSPGRPMDRLLMPAAVKTAFVEAFRDVGSRGGPRGLCLVGAQGCGRKALVQAALAAQGRPLVVLDVTGLPPDEERRRAYLAALVREVVMVGGVLYLEGVEPNPPVGAREALADLVAALSNYQGPVVAGSLVRAREALRGIGDFVEVEVPFPDADDQERLWRGGFSEECRLPPGFDVREVVGRYTLSGGAIRAVCREAARWADTAGRRAKSVPASVVVDAIRGQLTHRLSSLAIPVHKGEGWEDLVLPSRTVDLLKEIVSFFRNRRQILEQWGLGAKLLRSPGLPCLFSGQPGTGKTMAASIIARDLGREIFQVDLSRIVDKYIGETEKNLARVFEEGARAQAILLFDEADSLFAKRTDVKSSIDRYANLEVNYLLQRVESYDGIAILTTNFASSIDDAFKRRLRFSVEFPFPEQAERVRLWHALLPKEVPLAGQIDFDDLAERFVVSGGHIRNIIIRAVTLAADRKKSVDMAMFQQAGNAEYRLMGKLVREDTGD